MPEGFAAGVFFECVVAEGVLIGAVVFPLEVAVESSRKKHNKLENEMRV